MSLCRSSAATLLAVVIPGCLSSQAARDTSGAPPRDTAGVAPLTSETVIRGDFLRALPVDDSRQALILAPAVVLRGGDIGIGVAPVIAIRGSRLGAAAVYVDGAPVRFQAFGTQAMAPGTLGIDRISVTTGVPAASVLDAGGGVISYVTAAGGQRLTGIWRTETDEPFGDGSTVGYNRFEGWVGGPVPGVARLSWAASGTLYGQRSQYYGRGAADQPAYVLGGLDTLVQSTDASGSTVTVPLPRFVQWSGSCSAVDNNGFDCQGLRRPMDWSTVRRGQAKLSYGYGSGASLSFTALVLDVHQRVFPGRNIADPALDRGASGTSRLGVLNWSHPLGTFRGGPLSVSANLSLASDQLIDGPLTPASELATRDPGLGVEWQTLEFTGADSVAFPVSDAVIRSVRTGGLPVPFPNRTDLNLTQVGRLNPYGLQRGWPTSGLRSALIRAWEHRLDGRAHLEWQPGTRHHVTLGGDAERGDVSLYGSDLISLIGFDAFRAKPSRFGLFASDRLSLGAVVLDLGARYDHFTPGGDFPKTPGFIGSDPNWSPAAATSPRVRAAYAVAPSTSVRAAYGQQVELPALIDLFANTNSDLSFTNTTDVFGRDVDYAKSELMELGAQHAFGPHLDFDLSVYRKNNLVPYAFRILPFASPRQASDTLFTNVLTKVDGGHGTGVDARLDWQASDAVSGSVSYSFLHANVGSNIGTFFGSCVGCQPAVNTNALYAVANLSVPGDWSAGTTVGTLARRLGAVLTFRLATGLAYTRLVNNGDGAIAPQIGPGLGGRAAEQINASHLPTTKTLDLRLTKTFQAGGRALRAYADFRNLLNFTNVVALYAETGDFVNALHKDKLLSPELQFLQSEASQSGALRPDGSIDLSGNCNAWGIPWDCVALRRVEARFGNGDLLYTPAEQTRALDTYYNAFFGPWRFHGPARTVRVGVEVAF
ncbi:MAG: hypothetical protein DMD69_09915 [Gemmatimonadetes bacterium]|nr:MAG: hypothetical protein DMD69_09915 [Gemmatimonadota bacterium]